MRGLEGGRSDNGGQSEAVAEDGSEADPGRARPLTEAPAEVRGHAQKETTV